MKEIILIGFGGSRYGVWKDSVLGSRETGAIHPLPLSPAQFAGVSEIDGLTANIFDLASCMGHEPFDRRGAGRVLIMVEGSRPEGFVFREETERLEIALEDVHPMPDYFKAPAFSACVRHEGEMFPVIDIEALYERVLHPRWKPPVPYFPNAVPEEDPSGVEGVRVFELDGRLFAAPAGSIEEDAVRPGRIIGMPLAPPHVEGVAFLNGRVSTVINPARLMGLKESPGYGRLLVSKTGGFGFLVNSDMGRLDEGSLEIMPLPPLVSSSLMSRALLRDGEVIPLLNISALASNSPKEIMFKGHKPKSRFHGLFGKRDVKVLEFSLPGAVHSFPDSQVEDVVSSRPYRRITGFSPLVVGLAEHDGEILSVIDLAKCISRNSESSAGPEMVLLKNGDFRVLVLTEAVRGRRLLSLGQQLRLPVNLPHRFVYGCYQDGEMVRLILNAAALTIHFDERLTEGLLEATHALPAEGPEGKRELPKAGDVAGPVETRSSPEPPEKTPGDRPVDEETEAPLLQASPEPPEKTLGDGPVDEETGDPLLQDTPEPPDVTLGDRPVDEETEAPLLQDTQEPAHVEGPESAVDLVYGEGKAKNRAFIYAAVIVLLAVAVYFLHMPGEPVKEKARDGLAAVRKMKQEVDMKEARPHEKTSPAGEGTVKEVPEVSRAGEKIPVMVIELPSSQMKRFQETKGRMPGKPIIYQVIKGDTLWDISGRFTGNPFNYRYIAVDNKLQNPDMIEPGQKFIIKIKAESGP
jgi:chemotaxis signal transduction protein/nucleoid-associated protein YgaU